MAEKGIQIAVARVDLFLTTSGRLALVGFAITGLALFLWKVIILAIRRNRKS